MIEEQLRDKDGRTRRADAQRNRLRVLAAAWRLLTTKGHEGISMEEVAREAAIGRATLYRHYPTLESLFDALIEDGASRIALIMRERIPPEADAPTKLSALVAIVYDVYDQHGINLVVLLNSWCSDSVPPHNTAGTEHPITALIGRVRAILEQGVREGSFRTIDLDYTAMAIFSLINPVAFAKQRERLGYGRAALEERVLDLLLHALQAPPPPHPAPSI